MFKCKCGAPLEEGTPTCNNCGEEYVWRPSTTQAQQYQEPPQQGYSGDRQRYQPPGMHPGYASGGSYEPRKSDTYTKYLVLSIIQMLCCCLITGILGIVFTVQGENMFRLGDMEGYFIQRKRTKLCLIIGLVASLSLSIIYFVLVFLGVLGNLAEVMI